MPDWAAMRAEYMCDSSATYRSLAEKHGVSRRTIEERAKRERWPAMRMESQAAVAEKAVEVTSDAAKDCVQRISKIAGAMLANIEERMDQGLIGSIYEIRQLTAVLKDIKALYGIRTDLDEQEQRARIAKLRADAERDTRDTTQQVVVQIQGGDDTWGQ